MESIPNVLVQWAGLGLCLVLFLIAAAASGNREMAEALSSLHSGDGSYVLRYPRGRVLTAFLALLVGLAGEYAIGLAASPEGVRNVILLSAEALLAILVFVTAWTQLRKARACAVVVSGEDISVFQPGSRNFRTSFPQIRTVKKEKDGSRLVIRTEDRQKFTVDSKMSCFDRFALQAERDVTLPNLTRKRRQA